MEDNGVPGSVIDKPTHVHSWHSVYVETDEMASAVPVVDLIAMLVNFLEPMVIVEAGTYRGHMALAVANILRRRGEGTIHTADVKDFFTAALTLAEVTFPGISDRIVFHHGEFLDLLKDIPEVDLAYIDASSTDNEHLRMDHANAVWPKLKVGGLMLVDDTASIEWNDARLFRQWAQRDGIHLGQHRGLTILQKRAG